MTNKTDAEPAPNTFNLARWLGRREAFGVIAGRCSAAEVECLREIRDQKLYLENSANWDEFCRVQLRTSRRKVDTALRQLQQYGRRFFHAAQMMRLTEAEFVSVQEHLTDEGVKLDGQVIAWGSENEARITETMGKLRAIAAPTAGTRSGAFDVLLKRFGALNEQLESPPCCSMTRSAGR
jgi:hypothetical protein